MIKIQAGDAVDVRDSEGVWHPAIADSGIEGTHVHGRKVHDFPVVWVLLDGSSVPWPADAVRPALTPGGEPHAQT